MLGGANIPPMWSAANNWMHERKINSAEYKAAHGFWQVVELPKGQRINAIHAALLPSGRLLLIAGSGNDREQFAAGTFKTLVFDPVSGATTFVPTPTDLFCSGHAFLPDGKLLVAGGTLRYEVLKADNKRAGGTMTVKNESPEGPRTFPKGTVLTSTDGHRYTTNDDVTVPAATKVVYPPHHKGEQPTVVITAGEARAWVDAAEEGAGYSSSTVRNTRSPGSPASTTTTTTAWPTRSSSTSRTTRAARRPTSSIRSPSNTSEWRTCTRSAGIPR
jgi:hypothetical protein